MPNQIARVFRAAMRLSDDFVIQDSMSFDDIPGWDSVGHMNLVSELESQFAVSLDMDEILAIDSVKAVRDLIARKKAS